MTINTTHPSILNLKQTRWYGSTEDIRALDSGFDAFAAVAIEQISQPSIVVTRGEFFERLVPPSLHNCPAVVIWLPKELSGEVFDLAYTDPTVGTWTSSDLTERDVVLSWHINGIAFTTFEATLHESFGEHQNGAAIAVIFATETHTAITALSIDSDFRQELSDAAARCGEHYRASNEHSPQALRAAAKRKHDSSGLLDAEGRYVVFLRPRRAVRPGRLV